MSNVSSIVAQSPPTPSPSTPPGGWRQRCLLRILSPLAGFGCRPSHTCAVLAYHRIAPQRVADPYWLNVTPRRFQSQMEGLAARGYRALPLREVMQALQEGGELAPRSFAITFDDGFANVYQYAWPVLRKLKLPATIFLATAYMDSPEPFPFDPVPSAGLPSEFYRPLSWEQCRQMVASGEVDCGSHTHSHADFRGRPRAFADDVRQSLASLAHELRIERPPFAYPFGYYEPALAAALYELNIFSAFTTEPQLLQARADPLKSGRLGGTPYDTAASLAAKLEGWYGWLRHAWQQSTRLSRKPEGFAHYSPRSRGHLARNDELPSQPR